MINAVNNKPYSAIVQLILHVNGQDYELAKVGPSRIVLRNAIQLPACEATLSICIDGQVTQQTIQLPDGASADSPIVISSVAGILAAERRATMIHKSCSRSTASNSA